jgi:hypothetical protein
MRRVVIGASLIGIFTAAYDIILGELWREHVRPSLSELDKTHRLLVHLGVLVGLTPLAAAVAWMQEGGLIKAAVAAVRGPGKAPVLAAPAGSPSATANLFSLHRRG